MNNTTSDPNIYTGATAPKAKLDVPSGNILGGSPVVLALPMNGGTHA